MKITALALLVLCANVDESRAFQVAPRPRSLSLSSSTQLRNDNFNNIPEEFLEEPEEHLGSSFVSNFTKQFLDPVMTNPAFVDGFGQTYLDGEVDPPKDVKSSTESPSSSPASKPSPDSKEVSSSSSSDPTTSSSSQSNPTSDDAAQQHAARVDRALEEQRRVTQRMNQNMMEQQQQHGMGAGRQQPMRNNHGMGFSDQQQRAGRKMRNNYGMGFSDAPNRHQMTNNHGMGFSDQFYDPGQHQMHPGMNHPPMGMDFQAPPQHNIPPPYLHPDTEFHVPPPDQHPGMAFPPVHPADVRQAPPNHHQHPGRNYPPQHGDVRQQPPPDLQTPMGIGFSTSPGNVQNPPPQRYDPPPARPSAPEGPVQVPRGALQTWSFANPDMVGQLVELSTDGSPMDATVQLWQGPNNTPLHMGLHLDNGAQNPFRAFIDTRGPSGTVAVRNTGELDIPFSAVVEETTSFTRHEFSNPPAILPGHSDVSVPFDGPVNSVAVFLHTDGRPLSARIELSQGPNHHKQVVEVQTENGMERPFYTIIDTPGAENVVRVINTAPEQDLPLTTFIEPHHMGNVDARFGREGGYMTGH